MTADVSTTSPATDLLALIDVSGLVRALRVARVHIQSDLDEIRSSVCRLDPQTLKPDLSTMSDEDARDLAPLESILDVIDRALGGDAGAQFEDRALALLAEVWETPLQVVRDFPENRPLELRLGHFLPALSERIAGLLEEAGV